MTTSYSNVNSLDEFTIIGGNDFTFSFSITEDGLPVNLTGSTLLLKIAPYGQPNNIITTITGSIGATTDIAEFILPSITSEQMVGGKYMYQPVIQDTSGTIHRPKQGTFLLVQAIGAFSDAIEVPEAAYYVYGEGTNTYTSTNTTITAYYAGLSIVLYVQNTNSANSTLELSGVVGTKNLMKFDSIGGKVVLVAGDLLVDKKYLFVYDGTEWVLVGLAKSEIRSMLDPTYAPLASPVFTGNPTAPTPTVGDNDTSIATTAFVNAEISNDRPYSDTNPLMDGTAAQGTSEKISRQDHVHPTDTTRASLISPTFTGIPTAPTASVGTNTTQIATTAFVLASLPVDFISGLKLIWNSGTSITVGTGSTCLISGTRIDVSTAITKSSLSLSINTWYHIYLFNSVTPDIEIVTTAPDNPYLGTARAKIGDVSRRYLGSVLTNGSGAIYNFVMRGLTIKYNTANATSPFRVLTSGSATTNTAVSLTGVVPTTSCIVTAFAIQNGTVSGFINNSNDETIVIALTGQRFSFDTFSESGNLYYKNSGAGGVFNIDILGYTFER